MYAYGMVLMHVYVRVYMISRERVKLYVCISACMPAVLIKVWDAKSIYKDALPAVLFLSFQDKMF